jgi:hypothetical protein
MVKTLCLESNYWGIVELEVSKWGIFDGGIEGVRNANAIEVLTLFQNHLANQ